MGARVRCNLFVIAILFAVAVFVGQQSAYAQGGVGELTGVVYDPSGAVVSGAKITLSNAATGFERSMESASGGVYRFSALPVVAGYALTVEHSGFRAAKVNDVVVSVGTITTIDVHLEVGGQSEAIVVEAGAELVSPSESQVSELIDRTVWQNLPLEIRNQNTFINLVAGVAPNDMTGTTRGAAVNGARPGMGNFMLEGYDNNDQGQGGRGSEGAGAITSISPEAIQEYRVITHSYEAEYGKGGGFVTDTVLKSGTNSLHGSLFEYNRIQALAANDFFSNAGGLKDHLVRNQFGGSVGGPIWKNKWYFYGSYEGHRRVQSAPISTTTVTPEFLNFVKSGAFQTFQESNANGFCMQNFSAACPGAFSQSASLGPVFSKLMGSQPFFTSQSTPACNPSAPGGDPCAAQGGYTGGVLEGASLTYPMAEFGPISVSDPATFFQHRVSFKSDYKISDKDSLSGTFLYTTQDSVDKFGGGDATIGPAFDNPSVQVLIGLTWTHNFSANMLDQFRASYLRHRSDFPNPSGAVGVPDVLSFFDSMNVGFGNTSALPQFFTDNQFQYKDDLSIIHGKHTFKFGGEYRRTRNGSSFQSVKNGLFFFDSTEELLTDGFFGDEADILLNGGSALGSLREAEASINPITGNRPEYYRGYRANEYAFYGQDDWKIAPRFTLNLGLRWEYFGPPHNFRPGIDSNIFFGSPLTPITGITANGNPFLPVNNRLTAMEAGARAIQVNQNIWAKDTNNFGPRVGFAWDVMGNQKLIFRAGGGFYYDRIWNNLFENIRFNPPFFANAVLGQLGAGPAGPIVTPGLYADPFTNTQGFKAFAAKPSGRHMDQNLKTPYTQQANIGVQYALAKSLVLEVNGAYTGGRELTGVYDANTFDGRTGCPASASGPRGVCQAAFLAGEIPAATFTTARPNSTLSSDNFRTNAFASNYYGLQASVTKRLSNGLQFNSNYTWSHVIDTLSDAFRGGHNTVASPTDIANINADKGNADFDIRHRFVTSLYYELPFWKQHHWIGGWSTSGIVTVQKGVPIPILDGTRDLNRDNNFTDRPLITGNPYLGKNPADGFLNPASFAHVVCPTSVNFGIWCDSPTGRNTLIGPGFVNTDFGVAKKFRIRETAALQFQANFFNLFNHPNFDVPAGNVFGNAATFGKSTVDFGARVTQLALRFDF